MFCRMYQRCYGDTIIGTTLQLRMPRKEQCTCTSASKMTAELTGARRSWTRETSVAGAGKTSSSVSTSSISITVVLPSSTLVDVWKSINKHYNLQCSSKEPRHTIILLQINPFPLKPLLQEHEKLPMVSVQTAFELHGLLAHSLMSAKKK